MLLTATHSLDNIPSLVECESLLVLIMSFPKSVMLCTYGLLCHLPIFLSSVVQLHAWFPSTFGLYPSKGYLSISQLKVIPRILIAFLLFHHVLLEKKKHSTLYKAVQKSPSLGNLHWHRPPRQNYVISNALQKNVSGQFP